MKYDALFLCRERQGEGDTDRERERGERDPAAGRRGRDFLLGRLLRWVEAEVEEVEE